ncbi:MAG: hypothetical protein KKE04_00225, partial [Candidatus Thermoplasmatota archaeon]|nr:hypothetical protein [Candidatus Thermoplasmatota archaeon]
MVSVSSDEINPYAENDALTTAKKINADKTEGARVVNLSFDFLRPTVGKNREYDTVVIPGLHSHAMPGEPELPFKTVKILLPQGKDVLSVNVKTDKKIMLNGSFNIEPGQKPVPLTYGYEVDKHPSQKSGPLPYNAVLKNQQDRNQKNQTIYSSSKPFPGKLYDSLGVQIFRGYRILIVNLYPVQYIPKTGEIYYFE